MISFGSIILSLTIYGMINGRSQLKKFIGSKVRRTVGKAKMMASEVSLTRQKEEMIDIPDELTGGEQHVKVYFKKEQTNQWVNQWNNSNISKFREIFSNSVVNEWFDCSLY